MEARSRVAEAARTSAETALGAAQSQVANQSRLASQLAATQDQLTALQNAVASYCQKLASPPKPPCP
jgi:hypothetical protein